MIILQTLNSSSSFFENDRNISSRRAFKLFESNLNHHPRTRFYETFEKGYEGKKTWISRRFLEETIAQIYLEEQFRGKRPQISEIKVGLRDGKSTHHRSSGRSLLLLLVVSPRFTPFSSDGSRTKVADLEHDTIPPSPRLSTETWQIGFARPMMALESSYAK